MINQSRVALGPTVLVVDDCAPICGLIACQLGALAYRVLTACNAEEARDVIEEHGAGNISLLITDVNMPGMHGDELADWFRKAGTNGKVLLMSTHPCEMELGKNVQFLSKPFRLEELGERVSELLGDDAQVHHLIAG